MKNLKITSEVKEYANQLKVARKLMKEQLKLILDKYDLKWYDEQGLIDCSLMSQEDVKIYMTLDECLERTSYLNNLFNTVTK